MAAMCAAQDKTNGAVACEVVRQCMYQNRTVGESAIRVISLGHTPPTSVHVSHTAIEM
jgi:hypothetical protein